MSGPPAERAHPLAGVARRYSRTSVVAMGMAVLALLVGSYAIAAFGVAAGLLLFAYASMIRRGLGAAPRVNTAFELLSRGRTGEARAVLDGIQTTSPYIKRAIALQRALIAMHDGDTESASALTEEAATGTPKWMTRVYERRAIATALGLRAVVLAARGEDAASEEASKAAETAPDAGPDALARAELARCIRHARAGRLLEMAEAFQQKGSLMLECVLPRERALVRALRKMARSRPKSVYREPARPDDAPREQSALAGWIAGVVPEAARFATDQRPLAQTAERTAAPIAKRRALAAIADDRRRATKGTPGRGRRLGLTLAVFGGLVAALALLVPGATRPFEDGGSPVLLEATLWVLLMGVVGVAVFQFRRALRVTHEVQRTVVPVALRQYARASEVLTRIARGNLDQPAAMAHLQLANIALRQAKFDEARAAFDAGIARVTRSNVIRAASSDLLLPQLIAGRAFSLSLLGRADEADAEVAMLEESFPTFAFAAPSRLRVELGNALRARRIDAASAVAARRTPEMPLGLHEDLLADVAIAIEHPSRTDADREERERILLELEDDAEVGAFVEAILPGVRGELRAGAPPRAGEAVRARVDASVTGGASGDDDDDHDEDDALELEGDAVRAARRPPT